jgi:hypothetical protein
MPRRRSTKRVPVVVQGARDPVSKPPLTKRFPEDVQEGAVEVPVVVDVEPRAVVVLEVLDDAAVTVEVAVKVTVDLVQLMTLQLGMAALMVVVIVVGLVSVLDLTSVNVLYAVVVLTVVVVSLTVRTAVSVTVRVFAVAEAVIQLQAVET